MPTIKELWDAQKREHPNSMPTCTPTTRSRRAQRAFIALANIAAAAVISAGAIALAWLCGDLHITGDL